MVGVGLGDEGDVGAGCAEEVGGVWGFGDGERRVSWPFGYRGT